MYSRPVERQDEEIPPSHLDHLRFWLPTVNQLGVVHILRNHGWGGSLQMITVLHRGGGMPK